MKKFTIYTAAIASMVLALASCEKEPSISEEQKGTMRLHVVSEDIQTKSATASTNKIVSETIDLSEGDVKLFFSAVEEDNLSNEFITGPVTKGEIITTDNFETNRSDDFHLWLTTTGNTTYKENGRPEAKNVPVVPKEDYWFAMYKADGGEYGDYIHWPNDKSSLNFWCWSGKCASDLAISADGTKMTFNYSGASAKASEQSDLLFAYTDKQTEPKTKGDVAIHFDHALAAVQFCIGKLDDGVKITNIKLSAVKNSGSCEYIPANHDKTDANLFNWTVEDSVSEFSTGEISNNNTSEATQYDPIGDEATSTFFFVPQDIKDVEIEISITSSNGNQTSTLKKKIGLGSVSYDTMPAWKAGKIYRYTISGAGEVDVMVNEEFNAEAKTKSNIKAQNTGTISSWVRGIVIANWCDVNGKAIAPYTGEIIYDETNWAVDKDRFYYYKKQLPAGESTENLISSFTADETSKPDYKLSELHLEMKVMFQAVECHKDSNYGRNNFNK